MDRIDTHFHIWDLEANRYPWLQEHESVTRIYGDTARLRQSYRWDDYLKDCAKGGVTSAVYIQCNMHDPIEEARYVSRVTTGGPQGFRVAIVGYANLADEASSSVLDALAALPNVRGVRLSVAWHDDPITSFVSSPDILKAPTVQASVARLEERGLRLDCMLFPAQAKDLAALAARHPGLSIIVNHAGLPVEQGDPGLDRWREAMHLLAEHANVSVKLSGLGMIWPDWTTGRADAVINDLIDIFGDDRCMVGSNHPVERLSNSYEDVFDAFHAAIAHRTSATQRKILSENAARIYGI